MNRVPDGSDETTLQFGPEGSLLGVLSPSEPRAGAARIGCLLLNVGVNHRIGPRRLNVKLARELAAAGIPSLRIDLSGLGDSRASSAQDDFRQQTLIDMGAALDQLQAHTSVHKFIVVGICSGGANGLSMALVDPRIVGLLMFDGHIFLTPRVRLERKLRRWAAFPFNPAVRRSFTAWNDWMAWLAAPGDAAARARALGHLFGRFSPRSAEETDFMAAGAQVCSVEEFKRDMNALLARHVDVYLMYSATLNSADRDKDLLQGVGDPSLLSRLRYEFMADTDHTITPLAAQRRFMDKVLCWARAIADRQAAPMPMGAAPAPRSDSRLAA